jgi:hypothetical protein
MAVAKTMEATVLGTHPGGLGQTEGKSAADLTDDAFNERVRAGSVIGRQAGVTFGTGFTGARGGRKFPGQKDIAFEVIAGGQQVSSSMLETGECGCSQF